MLFRSLMSFEKLKLKYDIRGTILDYNYLLHSLPDSWKKRIKHVSGIITYNLYISAYHHNLLIPFKGSKIFYDKLITQNDYPEICNKWQTVFPECVFDWYKVFNLYRYNLKDVKLLEFQYKFLNKAVYTKRELLRMHLVDNDMCTFCNDASESLCHVYWDCSETQTFWKELESWINMYLSQNIVVTKYLIWFGVSYKNPLLSLIIISAKRHINVCNIKGSTLNFKSYVKILKESFSVESFISNRDNTLEKFNTKWAPLIPIFRNEVHVARS